MVDSVYSSTPLLGMHSDRSRGGSSMGFHGSSMGLVHPHPHPHTPPSAKLSKGKKEKGEKGEKEQRTRRRLKKKSRKPDDTIIPIPVGGVNIGAVIAGEEDGEERDQLRGLTRVRSYSPPPPPTLASQGAPNLRAYHHHQYSSSRPLTPPLPPLPVPHDGAGDATAASRGSSSSLHLPDPQFVPPPLPSSSSSSQTPPPPHAQISNSTNQATTSNGSKSPLLTRIGSMKRWGRRARSSTGPEAVIAHESSSSAGPSHPASSTFPAAFTSTSTSPVLVPSPGTPELKRGKSRDRLRALIQGALGGDQFLSEDDKTPKPSRIQVANAKAQAYAQAGPMPSAPSQGNASGKSTKTKGRSRSGTTGSIHPDPSSSSTNLVNPSGLPSSGRLDKPIPFVVGDGGGVGARRPVSLQPQSRVGSNADAKTAFPRSVSATNVPPASTATAPDHPRESGEEQREEVNGKPEVSFAQTQEKDVVKDKEKEKEGRRGFMDGVRRISFVGRHRRGKSVGVGVDLTPSASTVAPTSTSAIPSTSRAGPGYAKEKGALPAVPSASSSAVALDLEPEQDERDVRSTSRLDHLPQPIVPQLEPPAEILPPKATSLQIPPQVLPSTTPTPTSTTATASTTTSLPTFPKPDTPSRISPIQAASLGRANGTLITSSSSQGPASAANGTTGANVGPRRSSLGDLKIPSRISRAQIGIKRDLGMVREFAGNIEQLKKLQTTYVMLLEEADPEPVHGSRSQSPPPVTTTVQYHMPRPPSRSTSASTSQSLPGSQSRAKSKIPNEDLRRISLQYSKWWEAAEVLINLGGATPDSPASSTMSPPSAPPPVNPRSTSAVSAPILESKEKEKEPVQLQPSASPTKSTVARSRAVTLASDSPNRPTASVSGTDTTRSEKPWSESVGKQDLSTRQLMILKEMLNSPDPGSGSIALRDLPLPEGSTTELASPMNVGVGTSTGGREGLGLSGNWLGSMISVNTQAEGEVDDRDGAKSPTKKRRKSRLNGLKDLLKTLKKTLGDVDLTDPSPLQSNPNGQKDYHIQPMELSGSSASVLSSLEPHSRPATQLSYHRPHSKQQQYAQHQPPPPPPSDLQARHPPAHQRHQRHRSRDESSSNTKIDHGVQSRHRSNTGPARRLHPNSPYIATDIPMPDSRPPPPKSPRRPSLASIFRLGNTTKNKPAPIPHKTKDEEMLTHWDHLDSTSDIEAAAQGLHGHSTIRGNGRSRPGSAAGNAAAHNQSRRRPPSRQKSSHQLRTGRPETPVALRSASASQTSFLESSPQTVSHTSHSQHGHSIYPVSEYANAAPAPSTRRVTDGYPNGSTYNGPPPAFSSVRSAPPASMSTPTLGDPRLLLTPENIEPLLGYAKRVNEELGKCVEEIKVLLVSPASSGAR
ncbi:hypothetical protein SISSUDRAFT_402061 [Sistotremastrum suecicum HHB10207 ss-3]|uniref:Uncharacterized protein n=1 Tax=Sistotremastrum suecicum HHB10207 ss-3 TaxID=1314776 RepID=A0A166FSI2_9AGAM|nr:hypothetical protein SISSUDRAFT_402061 [Sistotremastrum suecicum HHB10207 ss-3]